MIELIFVTLFLVWQAIAKPFKNYFIELSDLFFTLNFIMMAIASLHLLNVENLAIASHKQKVLAEVLISFVFVVFCGIIAIHVLKALHRIPKIGEKMDWIYSQAQNWFSSGTKMDFIKQKMRAVAKPLGHVEEDGSVELTGVKSERSTDTTQTTVSLDTAESVPETSNDTEIRSRKLTKADFSQLREPALDA